MTSSVSIKSGEHSGNTATAAKTAKEITVVIVLYICGGYSILFQSKEEYFAQYQSGIGDLIMISVG